MSSFQTNQSGVVTSNGQNNFSLNGYNIKYSGTNLLVSGNGSSMAVPMMNNSTEYLNNTNGNLSASLMQSSNSFASAKLLNGKLSVTALSGATGGGSGNSGNTGGGSSSGNDTNSNPKFNLGPMILAINGELEEIKDILPLKAFMSIDKNIENILKAMALANFKLVKNPEVYSGLQWVIYGVYYNENLALLETPMTSSNVSSWTPSKSTALTNAVYSGCSYNLANYVGGTTSTNTSGVNAVADNTGQSNFTVVWSGYFMPNSTGTWKFQLASDDGSYLWVNSETATPITNFDAFSTSNLSACGIAFSNAIVNDGQQHGVVTVSNSSTFTEGVLYPIVILSGQGGGGYSIDVTITDPTGVAYSENCSYILGNYISN